MCRRGAVEVRPMLGKQPSERNLGLIRLEATAKSREG